jgi:hypothetical protein
MTDPRISVQDKVLAIFRELAPDRAERLAVDRPAVETIDAMAEALRHDYPQAVARDIAFHLADWNWDAAFLVALHLFQERFSVDEVRAGVELLLVHAPNHLVAAAKLAGEPVRDVFGLGTLVEDVSPMPESLLPLDYPPPSVPTSHQAISPWVRWLGITLLCGLAVVGLYVGYLILHVRRLGPMGP